VAALLAASMAAAATAAADRAGRQQAAAGGRVAPVADLQHAGSQQRKELPQNGLLRERANRSIRPGWSPNIIRLGAQSGQQGKIPAHENKLHWDSPTNGWRPARPCKSCNLTDQ
jgi:hypothetical protein